MPSKTRKRARGASTTNASAANSQAALYPTDGARKGVQPARTIRRSTNWLLLGGAGLLLIVLAAIFAFLLFRQGNGAVPTNPTPGPPSAQGRISFVRGNADPTRDVYVVDPDGSRLERVTSGIYIEGITAWSPDGRYIIAQIAQEGISTIARVAVASDNKGGDVVALTSDMTVDNTSTKADSALPAWSPDGSLIAFQSKKEGGNFQVYVMDKDGHNKRRVSSGQGFGAQAAWSPDGKSIAYVGGDKVDPGAPKEIYTVSVEGGTPRQITTLGKDLSRPTWSPDGKQMLYLENLSDKTSNIMIMNADGSGARKLADGIRASNPQFNPAGDKVLYYYISLSPPTGSDIFIVPTAGGQPTTLTPNTPEDYQPAWSPDGKMLTWSSILTGITGHKIVVAGADGSGVRVLSSGEGDDFQPQWGAPPKP